MPPQLLFDDEKLSYILSYVNNAWGNQENIITKEEVAKARKELPLDVFTPQTLLKDFLSKKKYSKKNGTYTPTFDDTLTRYIFACSLSYLYAPEPHPPPSP